MKNTCDVCFRHCKLNNDQVGVCYARKGSDAEDKGSLPVNYGHVTSIALDPIEKKPLYHFHPGSRILSVGSYGCNMKCPFCQNVSISMADDPVRHHSERNNPNINNVERSNMDNAGTENDNLDNDSNNIENDNPVENAMNDYPEYEYVSPETLTELAKKYVPYGNIGAAFTYNEPLVCYEYVRDTAKLLKDAGLCTVVVTNGSVMPWVIHEAGPYIDAMNIDLKSFSLSYYRDVLKGDLDTVKESIITALKYSHVELTTLIIPGENDSVEEMHEITEWIAGLEKEFGKEIPFHISRFFPRSRYADRRPTDIAVMKKLYEIAAERLSSVYLGNC